MTSTLRSLIAATALTFWAIPAFAQTADEIIEKHLAASGGREAMARINSRISTGTISLTTPVGDLKGTIEVSQKRPNKTRTLIKIDAAAIGGGQITSDQRFDGNAGYMLDSFNGNRDITGDQLEAMKAGTFPTPFLNYKESGMTVALAGQEKVNGRDAFVVQLKPKTGPGVKAYFDAENFMLVKTIITVNVPQLGGPIDQVVEFSDFRDVDGVKIPYVTKSSNPVQTVVATVSDVKQNVDIDDNTFAKPAQ
jgi:outer membrane lipoprotein-sorting protein